MRCCSLKFIDLATNRQLILADTKLKKFFFITIVPAKAGVAIQAIF
jgi:hypothetical protein